MTQKSDSLSRRFPRQRGQAVILIILLIGAFLLAGLGIALDYSQLWAHRQMAQAAADAACQAGAADLFLQYQNPSASTAYGIDFGWVGASFSCTDRPSSAPCTYARLNGYPNSAVSVDFPSSVDGVDLSGFGSIAHPFIRVSITDPVNLSLTKLYTSATSVDAKGSAVCGMNPVAVPIPLVVLHQTASGALSVSGNPSITIYGGPNRSIQVDSSSTTAVSAGGSSSIDLTKAGPTSKGADFGVFGNETKPAPVSLGIGKWVSPAMPYGDPWITQTAPGKPAAGTARPVPLAWNGCPDPDGCVELSGGDFTACSAGSIATGGNGCLAFPYGGSNAKFSSPLYPNWLANHAYTKDTWIIPTASNPGNYVYVATNSATSAAAGHGWNQTWLGTQVDGGITWQNIGKVSDKPNTAIFDPGLYYVGTHGLDLGSNSTVRTSTAVGDGSKGVTFYFSTTDTVSVNANAGKATQCTAATSGSGTPNGCIVPYQVDGTAELGVLSQQLQCPGGPANPSEVYKKPDGTANGGRINGNILIGPCSGDFGSEDGKNRGFLFFQNRATAANANWGGGGQFLLSGFMYFHNTGGYGSSLSLSGNSGAGAFTLGNIVTDKVTLGGSSGIKMILNPASTFQILRPQLLK